VSSLLRCQFTLFSSLSLSFCSFAGLQSLEALYRYLSTSSSRCETVPRNEQVRRQRKKRKERKHLIFLCFFNQPP
jgi:hypothetical protein